MGVSLSWIAVRGLGRETALEELGFELGNPVSRDYLPQRFGVAELPNGWLLLMTRDLEGAFEDRFVALSRHGPAVACALEEHVMYSEARGYEAGVEIWRIVHNPDEGDSLYSLEASGELPTEFERIRREAVAEQAEEGGEDADCDFVFEVPEKVAKSLCGYSISDSEPFDPEFRELRKALPSPSQKGPGLFQRLFGRKQPVA